MVVGWFCYYGHQPSEGAFLLRFGGPGQDPQEHQPEMERVRRVRMEHRLLSA